jgi:hypothetical protein
LIVLAQASEANLFQAHQFCIQNKSDRLAFFWRTNNQDHFVLK